MKGFHKENTQVSTIFYQGITCSQTNLSFYTGKKGFIASTGEKVVCNHAIDILHNPFVGNEIQDVNLQPFDHWGALFNPVNWGFSFFTSAVRMWYGISVSAPESTAGVDQGSVCFHSLHLQNISIGQETDIDSHDNKYQAWKEQKQNPADSLVLFGVSRGAATTFNAFARHHYDNVKLVILEGCFYSIDDILENSVIGNISPFVTPALSYLAYDPNGPSPAKSVAHFPEGTPIAFISSKIDMVVPYTSTLKLAQLLADRGKNPVYLLTLTNSSHIGYMFDDQTDRKNYEIFIHALYQAYDLPHDVILANQGKALLNASLLKPKNDIYAKEKQLLLNFNTEIEAIKEAVAFPNKKQACRM